MRPAIVAATLAWSVAASADAPPRTTLELASLPSSAPFDVHGDLGLAGVHEGRPLASLSPDADVVLSKCVRQRRGSIVWNEVHEIVTIRDREYLDTAELDANEAAHVVVSSHQRRLVTRIATLGAIGVWAWREGGSIHYGAFADFGENDHAQTSFGCRWMESEVSERGGTATLFSEPSMSDPPSWVVAHAPPKATGPTFSIALSVSRSSSDAAPLVVLRARTFND